MPIAEILTSVSIPPGEPLLLAGLQMHRLGPDRGRPMLILKAHCPFCWDIHSAAVPDDFPIGAAVPLAAPCPAGAFVGRTIYLVVDPARAIEAGRLLRGFSRSLRRYLVERKLRRQPEGSPSHPMNTTHPRRPS